MPPVAFHAGVKWTHVLAVGIAVGRAFTYPIWFRFVRSASLTDRVMFHRAQAFLGQWVISPGLLVIVLAGVYMATDRHYWSKVWVTVPLLIAIGLGALGGVFFGPKEKQLAELAQAGDAAEYDRVFGLVRNVTLGAILAVAVAAYMMVTKVGS